MENEGSVNGSFYYFIRCCKWIISWLAVTSLSPTSLTSRCALFSPGVLPCLWFQVPMPLHTLFLFEKSLSCHFSLTHALSPKASAQASPPARDFLELNTIALIPCPVIFPFNLLTWAGRHGDFVDFRGKGLERKISLLPVQYAWERGLHPRTYQFPHH